MYLHIELLLLKNSCLLVITHKYKRYHLLNYFLSAYDNTCCTKNIVTETTSIIMFRQTERNLARRNLGGGGWQLVLQILLLLLLFN